MNYQLKELNKDQIVVGVSDFETLEQLQEWKVKLLEVNPEHTFEEIDRTAEIEFKAKLEQAKLEIEKGMKALALFKVRVKDKGLSTSQIAQLFGDEKINKIISTLSTGSLPLAVALISSYPADGVIVTEEDKLALIEELM